MRQIICFLVLTGLLACTGPDHDLVTPDEPEGPPPSSSAPGFGNSKERPLGTPFAFPAGITLVQKPRVDGDCWYETQEAKKVKGSGNEVGFCVSFRNSTNAAIRVELPPSLIWVAEKVGSYETVSQNGILVKTVSILVPAHAVETTWIMAYCINYDRSGSRPGDTYESQPIVSNHPGIKALTQQLATKKINEEEYTNRPTAREREKLDFIGVAVVDVQTHGTVRHGTARYPDSPESIA